MFINNKYGAQKCEVRGKTFASRLEARRWQELSVLESRGVISDLETQPCFELQPGFRHKSLKRKAVAIKYTADFAYNDRETGEKVVEEVKNEYLLKTDASYNIRKRLFLYQNPDIVFVEIKK